MTDKMNIGRLCEYLVKVIVEAKTGYSVDNINDEKKNHPCTDLMVRNKEEGEGYEISVKAKQGASWPSVKGISNSNEYIIFVNLLSDSDPEFFILNNEQWAAFLKEILPTRSDGAEIIGGSIEWHWQEDGRNRSFKGTAIKREELLSYKDNWSALPGVASESLQAAEADKPFISSSGHTSSHESFPKLAQRARHQASEDHMEIWNNCTMTTLYHSEDASGEYPCVVKIEGEHILVEYDDDGVVQYEGRANGEGHFELRAGGFDGRATLHRFPASTLLEGSWVEEGARGMWRIRLA